MIHLERYRALIEELKPYNASLLAVSKTKPSGDILELQKYGQKIFGENYVQELIQKAAEVKDAEWHFIGHLQTNKVKQLLPVANVIQGVDSLKLLYEINKQASALNKIQNCLLQIYIAKEETKFGFSPDEIAKIYNENLLAELKSIRILGFMGMATNTDDEALVRDEFRQLRKLYNQFSEGKFNTLSMGMTSDDKIALEEGSTMIRIGSAIFGERDYSK